jgi:hypothetical protein
MMVAFYGNLDILIPMDSWRPNFDNGSKKYMGSLLMEIIIVIYYVLHN